MTAQWFNVLMTYLRPVSFDGEVKLVIIDSKSLFQELFDKPGRVDALRGGRVDCRGDWESWIKDHEFRSGDS